MHHGPCRLFKTWVTWTHSPRAHLSWLKSQSTRLVHMSSSNTLYSSTGVPNAANVLPRPFFAHSSILHRNLGQIVHDNPTIPWRVDRPLYAAQLPRTLLKHGSKLLVRRHPRVHESSNVTVCLSECGDSCPPQPLFPPADIKKSRQEREHVGFPFRVSGLRACGILELTTRTTSRTRRADGAYRQIGGTPAPGQRGPGESAQ